MVIPIISCETLVFRCALLGDPVKDGSVGTKLCVILCRASIRPLCHTQQPFDYTSATCIMQ